jgi:hypothetical protein
MRRGREEDALGEQLEAKSGLTMTLGRRNGRTGPEYPPEEPVVLDEAALDEYERGRGKTA